MSIESRREVKAQLIGEINDVLVSHGKPAITPKDFDKLYDMNIKELVSVKRSLIRELFEYPADTPGLP